VVPHGSINQGRFDPPPCDPTRERLPPLHSLQHWPGMAGKLPPVARASKPPVRPRQEPDEGDPKERGARIPKTGPGRLRFFSCRVARLVFPKERGNIDHVRHHRKERGEIRARRWLSTFI